LRLSALARCDPSGLDWDQPWLSWGRVSICASSFSLTASAAWRAPSLLIILARWISTVRGLISNCRAIALFDEPSASHSKTSRSRRDRFEIRLRASIMRLRASPKTSASPSIRPHRLLNGGRDRIPSVPAQPGYGWNCR